MGEKTRLASKHKLIVCERIEKYQDSNKNKAPRPGVHFN